MKKQFRLTLLFLGILLLIFFGYRLNQQRKQELVPRVFFAMDTFFEIQAAPATNWEAILPLVQSEIQELDKQLNVYREDSEIAFINQNAASYPVKVTPETFDILQKAIQYGTLSKGLFDITFQPLQDLYGFDDGQYCVPTAQIIEEARKRVGYGSIRLDPEKREVFFSKPGIKLNVSGLIKGIALDRVVVLLQRQGLSTFSLNFGGNLYIQSEKEDVIGIKNPTNQEIAYSFSVQKGFVSTSSNGEQYFILNNQRYSHIVNPVTGSAIGPNDSVTVVTESGILSDFLSTYLYLIPPEEIDQLMKTMYPTVGYYVIQKNQVVLRKDLDP